MADLTSAQVDLRRLSESLKGTSASIRAWIGTLKQSPRADEKIVSGQLERAARYLDQAVRALRSPAAGGPVRGSSGPEVPGLMGSTAAAPITSIVGFLGDVHASGVLRIYGADETYVLQFEDGFIVYAHGDNPPDGMLLGELLVNAKAIARADLVRALERCRRENETLGGLLVREGYIAQEELAAALAAQIQSLGNRLFSERDARFRYYPGERVLARQDVCLNVVGLLLESARQFDEARARESGAARGGDVDLGNLGSEIEAAIGMELTACFQAGLLGQGLDVEFELGTAPPGAREAEAEAAVDLALAVEPVVPVVAGPPVPVVPPMPVGPVGPVAAVPASAGALDDTPSPFRVAADPVALLDDALNDVFDESSEFEDDEDFEESDFQFGAPTADKAAGAATDGRAKSG